jgi:hypothetical protein
MQPWDKTLTDQKIADVLTYERSEWGNNASPVTAEQIAALRKELANHPNSFTEPEILAAPEEDLPGGAPGGAPPKPGEAAKPGRTAKAERVACSLAASAASRVFAFPVALSKPLAFSVRSAEDVAFRRHHHVVEVLGEHRSGEKTTARNVSLPTLTRSCFTGVGMAKTLPGPTGRCCHLPCAVPQCRR